MVSRTRSVFYFLRIALEENVLAIMGRCEPNPCPSFPGDVFEASDEGLARNVSDGGIRDRDMASNTMASYLTNTHTYICITRSDQYVHF